MQSLGDLFLSNSGPALAAPPMAPRRKRDAPFSIRLSEADRARLAMEAAGAPLGSYIKAKLLSDGPKVRRRSSGHSVEDRQALAKVLALLGSSRLSSNLSQLAHLANVGALPFTPEIEADLIQALADVRAIRACLIAALGLKDENRREDQP